MTNVGPIRDPRVPLTLHAQPTKLKHAVDKLVRDFGERRGFRTRDAVTAARALMADWKTGRPVSTLELRGLTTLAVSSREHEATQTRAVEILRMIQENLGYKDLISLWPTSEQHAAWFGAALAACVIQRLSRGPRRIPPWMIAMATADADRAGHSPDGIDRIIGIARSIQADPSRMRIVNTRFVNPKEHLTRWILAKSIPLHEIASHAEVLGVSMTVGIGLLAVVELIRRGTASWWAMSSLSQILEWGRETALPVQQRLAERLLLNLKRAHDDMGTVFAAMRNPDSDVSQIRNWVLLTLGEPEDTNGRWEGIDASAREFFARLSVLDEFEKILRKFRDLGDERRADFWLGYVNAIRDAELVQAHDSAVCVLGFENLVVVEFGTIGNAAYIYKAPSGYPRLTAMRKARFRPTADFKSQSTLQIFLGRRDVTFLDRIIHNGAWEGRTRGLMASFKVFGRYFRARRQSGQSMEEY